MRRVLVGVTLTLLFLISTWNASIGSLDDNQEMNAGARNANIVISELFVSPNNLVANETSDNVYGSVDWNGDGDYGKFSDQFIEIWNSGDSSQDVSSWLLSTTSGSPPCQLPYNTTLNADERIVVFRADSDLDLSYYDGETVSISDTSQNVIHSMSFPAGDSSYGLSYISDGGTISKDDPTPGRAADYSEPYTVPDNIVNCYKLSNTDSSRAFLLKGRVVTMDGETNVINDGNVMVRDGKITGVWASNTNPPAGVDFTDVPIVETDGTIYPGLIDLHNHVHYNHIPLWDFEVHLSESQKSEEGGYTNRYQWGNNWDYGPSITWMKTNIQSSYRWDMASEQMKYAEVQAVSGGVTAMQGSPSSGTQAWDSILSRNVELYNFGQDGISTCAVCGAADDDYTGSHLISQSEAGTLNAWFVHLSEGVDQSSKDEFDALWNKGLIMDETIVIHGTALDSSQFSQMASVNSELVWSPLSNLLLYGDTTDVVAAHQAGVSISISPDWGPSGSKNNLHELKVADMWNSNNLNGYFSNYQLVEMVTSNPADATGWAPFVGRIKADLYADLVVIDTFHEDPYRNLIEAIDADVALTVVQGKAVFGDVDIMQQLQGDDWEYVNATSFQKAVDVTSLTEVDGSQTFAEIEAGLAMAMRHEYDDMKANWVEFIGDTDEEINAWLNTTFDGDYRDEVNRLKNMTLDPIFTTGDARYFDVINRSSHANYHIDMSQLYDNYYTVEMVNGDRTNINVQLPDDTINNGNNNNDNSNNGGDTTTLPGPVDNNTVDNDDDMFSDLPDDQFTDETEADQATKNQLKLILGLIVIILLFGLYVVSRTDDSDELLNSQNSVIDKMWDDEDINQTIDAANIDTTDANTPNSIDIKDKVASAMKSSGLSAVRLFTAIDQTDDGYVSRREIRTAVNTLLKDSVKVTDIDAMLETFDTNGDGVISLDEFLTVMEAHQPKQFVPVLPDLKPPPKGD
ncbi:MAG: amidohydrolase family protein [Candidatus Thermoplasmatota archaeon]|nr:amidohydrolase family protein [Candidatus Thermoplasmatota archaeon]